MEECLEDLEVANIFAANKDIPDLDFLKIHQDIPDVDCVKILKYPTPPTTKVQKLFCKKGIRFMKRHYAVGYWLNKHNYQCGTPCFDESTGKLNIEW